MAVFTVQCPRDQNKRENKPYGDLSTTMKHNLHPKSCKDTLFFQIIRNRWTKTSGKVGESWGFF